MRFATKILYRQDSNWIQVNTVVESDQSVTVSISKVLIAQETREARPLWLGMYSPPSPEIFSWEEVWVSELDGALERALGLDGVQREVGLWADENSKAHTNASVNKGTAMLSGIGAITVFWDWNEHRDWSGLRNGLRDWRGLRDWSHH